MDKKVLPSEIMQLLVEVDYYILLVEVDLSGPQG